MKKIKPLTLVIVSFFFMASCETDDIESKKLDSSLFWVSFVGTSTSSSENTPGTITSKISLSATTQETDVAVKYTVSSPDDAVEGVDYTLPEGFGSAVIPAGEHFVDVELATLINDDIIEGDKTLIFTIESAGNFNVGLPDTQEGNSYTLTIKEDDFTLIAGTSFEEPIGGTGYSDDVTQDITHDLVNNPGDAPVDYVSTGNELGFDATFISTRVFNNPNGLNDEPIGVLIAPPFDTDAFTDGDQGYSFADTDGIIKVTFDQVDISGFAEVFVSLDMFVRNTGYEPGNDGTPDKVRVSVIVDGAEELSMIDLEAEHATKDFSTYVDSSGVSLLGVWNEQRLDLTGFTTAQLVIEVDVNFNSEGALFDNIQFLGL